VPPPDAETVTDGTALLRAICKFPADDDPRLQYADWLDDRATSGVCPECHQGRRFGSDWPNCPHCHGSGRTGNGFAERAEFIRVQCQLAAWDCTFKQTPEQPGWKHNCGTDDKGYWLCQPLRSRARELFRNAGLPGWFTDLPGSYRATEPDIDDLFISTAEGWKYIVRRGFVAEVRLPCAAFLDRAAALFAAHPVVRVRLTDREPLHIRTDLWGWYSERELTRAHLQSNLPHELFELLDGDDKSVRTEVGRRYQARDAGPLMDALSAAAVAFGRAKAGLEG
jgi:uncharacterized protein (TIGR02996 family)